MTGKTKPTTSHDFAPEKFPLAMRIYSSKTGKVVWSRTVTLGEARALVAVEIPSYADTEHYPVRIEITYADGTTTDGGMQ